MSHLCIRCDKEFIPHYNAKNKKGEVLQKYCSVKCQVQNTRADWAIERKISNSTLGSISELLVCMDLMKKGYEVFRNLSPNGINDLVAYKDDKFCGIDVKSGYRNIGSGAIAYPKNIKAKYVAVVLQKSAEIFYYPEIN